MFNPHIHQQQQQQQQFHQHLRQLQQLFQQQPPPPPPPQPPPGHHVAHHHQTQRALPVAPQTAPPARMVNLCQATQTTIIAPNPMLQGAIMMQQMQGNMRSFGMGAQQFRQFFGARSSLLGPVPMGMAIKSPMMGFPAARPFHPHARYYNNTPITTSAPTTAATSASSSAVSDSAARLPDRKRDSDQMEAGSSGEQAAAESGGGDASDKVPADGAVGGVEGAAQIPAEQQDEPVAKKQRTESSEKSKDGCVAETVAVPDGVFPENFSSSSACSQPQGCLLLPEGGFAGGSDGVETTGERRAEEVHSSAAPCPSGGVTEDSQQARLAAEDTEDKDTSVASPEAQEEEEEEEGAGEGANKFYCYLCSITCHNQHNFRSHMNSISHQQRMMEIQHMSNACLVTLLPRVQESLQGANKEGEKKSESKRWCSTCHTHFSGGVADHRRTMEHKLASRTDISSCAICKKHFKTSQAFLEHLQSHEHRQKLQEKGCEALSKLAALDTDGFSLEEEEGSEEEEEAAGRQSDDGGQRDGQDGWSSFKEVTLDDMTSDEQHDPDTVYGSSFLVPVAGFICGLCNKFYHFEASALHTHCKSLKHFENLKRYRATTRQKSEAVVSPADPLSAADSLRPSSVCPEDFLADDTSAASDPLQPTVALAQLKPTQLEPTSQDSAPTAGAAHTDRDSSLSPEEAEDASQTPAAPQTEAEGPAGSSQEADSEPAAAAAEANNEEEEEEEEMEAPVVQGRRSGTGKGKTVAKRRSGRAGNRR